jgi:hypothetical protein
MRPFKNIMLALISTTLVGTQLSLAEEAPRIQLTGHVSEKPGFHIPGILNHELIELEFPEVLPERVTLDVPIEGVMTSVNLFRYSLRAIDFEMLVDDGLQLNVMEPSPHRTYRGSVQGLPESTVRASILKNGVVARIDLGEGRGVWWMQPLHSLEPDGVATPEDATDQTHVLMNGASGSFLDGYMCGNDFYDIGGPEGNSNGGLAGDQAGNRLNSIATCADYEFFQKNGSSVSNTLDDMELMINFYEGIYEDDASAGGVNMNFEFAATIIHANSNDPYSETSSSNILCEFRNEWNSGEETGIRRDMAQMFTGKNVGSTIGIAWLGVVCNASGNTCGSNNNLAYSMVESKYTSSYVFRTSLGAHEIGHNYSAGHCDNDGDCEIMCSGNGGCVNNPNDFNDTSQASITNYINSAPCDIAVGEAIELPFADNFSSISSTTWIYNKGGIASSGAMNEPSPSNSLQLDATGSGLYASDEIRSRTILASNYGELYMSFHTQFRGVDSGEGLLIEYVSSSGNWTELDQIITATGTTESVFTFHEYEMPADAQSNRLRVRFTALVDSSGDDIYIDSLVIGDATSPPVDPPANDECLASEFILGSGTYPINLNGATTSAVPGCDNIKNDIWYYVVEPMSGTVTVSLCGSTALDSSIAIYNGLVGCPYQESHLIICQDDSAECGDDPYVQFSTNEYAAVYVRVGSYSGETPEEDLLLTISFEEDQDDCLGDFDDNGQVDGADLAVILGFWNTADGDLDGNMTTDGADLSIVLGNWGSCS